MDQPTAIAGADVAHAGPRAESGLRAFVAEVSRDRLLYLIIGLYLAGVWAVAAAVGRPEFFQPLIYAIDRLPALVLVLVFYVVAVEAPAGIRAKPLSPVSGLADRLRRHMTMRRAGRFALVFAAALFTGAFTSMKGLQNALVPFWADAPLARIDAALHLGVDPWLWLQPLLGHHAVTRAVQYLYLNGWIVAFVGFTAAMALSDRLAHLRLRFFLTYFAAWILLGNVMAVATMSGGPVYFGEITGDHARFADQIGYLAFSEGMKISSVDMQSLLWGLYSAGQMQLGAGISAFPSLHVAMATLFAITAFYIDRRLGWAMTAFAVMIQLGSVHLGWHYAIDGYASAVLVIAAWFGFGRVLRPRPAT